MNQSSAVFAVCARPRRVFYLLLRLLSPPVSGGLGEVLLRESVVILTVNAFPPRAFHFTRGNGRSVSTVEHCTDCQRDVTVNETLTLADMTRSQLWIINERNTICEYLRLMGTWINPLFFSPQVQQLIMYTHTLRDCSVHLYLAIALLVVSKLLSLYIHSILISSSGGVTDGAQPLLRSH